MNLQTAIDRGALFVVSHSGGKDSQAMTAYIQSMVPKDQIVIVHAHLPEVEWEGTEEFIKANSFGIPVHVCQAGKTFFEMVDRRGLFPSPSQRQCTSDLKRDPIDKVIRSLVKDRDNKLVINCMGMRAEESPGRAKRPVWKLNKRASKAGREVWDFLPIHEWPLAWVWDEIKAWGQTPFWIYAEGMTRKSCCFCIMASDCDLKTAARLRPELAKRYINKEREINHTLAMPSGGRRRFLSEIVGEQLNKVA